MERPTTAIFTPNDSLMFNKNSSKWYRFVDNGDNTLTVFVGTGGESAQKWTFLMVMSKDYARSVWNKAVNQGYERMTL